MCMVAEAMSDPLIERIADELKRPVRFDARFDDRVMAALEAPEVIPLHPDRVVRRPWYARPWTVRVSPIGMLAAAALVGVVVLGAWQLRPIEQVLVATAPIDGNLLPVTNSDAALDAMRMVTTQFTFYQKGLKSVALVGDLNDWDSETTPMTEVSEGVWTVSVPLLPGVYKYQFLVDGERWVTDPNAPQQPSDFGPPNSLITVAPKK